MTQNKIRFKNDNWDSFPDLEDTNIFKNIDILTIERIWKKHHFPAKYFETWNVFWNKIVWMQKIVNYKEINRACKIWKKNDILMSDLKDDKVIFLDEVKGKIFSNAFMTIHGHKQFLPNYLFQILQSNKFIKHKYLRCSWTTFQRIRNKRELFESFKINLPSLEEQERIAFFLWNIDKKIELEEKKLLLLNKL